MQYKSKLTAPQRETFAIIAAQTGSPKAAMIAIEPELKDKPGYAATKANRLMKRTDVQEKVQKKLESMQPMALKRVKNLIMSEDENVATKDAHFVIEHVRGKPVARNLNMNAKVNIEDALFDT